MGGHPLPSKELWAPPHLEGGEKEDPPIKDGDGYPSLLKGEVAISFLRREVGGHPLPFELNLLLNQLS